MPVLNFKYPTILDVAKRTDKDGKIDAIVEALSETNEMLQDMPAIECNEKTSHKYTVRTGLPSVTWTKLYGGIQPSKSSTSQQADSCGMIEALSDVDARMRDIEPDFNNFRLSEDIAFLEAMNQEMQRALFYESAKIRSERITGFTPRYSRCTADPNDPLNKTYMNVIDAGGTGANLTSMWLIGWSKLTIFTIYPEASIAGLRHTDEGEIWGKAEDGGDIKYLRSHFKWLNGLCVRDWRFAVRIANIDMNNLNAISLRDLMIDAKGKLPSLLPGVRLAFYARNEILTQFNKELLKVPNLTLNYSEVTGREIIRLQGIPVRRCDQLLITEDKVV